MEEKKKSKIIPIIVGLIIALLIFLIGYIVVTQYVIPREVDEPTISYLEN